MASLVSLLLLSSTLCPLIQGDYHQRSKRQNKEETEPGPINDPSKREPWHLPKKIETIKKGIPDTADYRVFFKSEHGLISPLHDIPLYSDYDRKIFNMIVEVPKLSNAKMQISLNETLNPLRHATKNGKLRYMVDSNVIEPYCGFMINYGALPNTWEPPNKENLHTGHLGGGDPLDVIEIGERIAKQGEVLQVKVLGVISMIDKANKTDWKIIAIDANNSNAAKLDDIYDAEKHYTGLLKGLFNWLKKVEEKDWEKTDPFVYNEEIKDREFAHQIIDDAQTEWLELMAQLGIERDSQDSDKLPTSPPGISIVNTCIRGSKGKITFNEAEAILNKQTYPTGKPGNERFTCP